jgi:DNA-binding response OmpR family regulator
MRVLIVESDVDTAEKLISYLIRHGHAVDHVGSGEAALASYERADLVLLDLELPDFDGVEVCRVIRAESETPVITFITGSAELDGVLSLQAGADDCMVKPYSFRELVARINAVMRRVGPPSAEFYVISSGRLHIDPRRREVWLDGQPVEVTRKEFDLLYMLALRPEAVISRKELMSKVWSDNWAIASRTVDTHVSTLRSKLGGGHWIVTVRGVGYRLGTGQASRRDHHAAAEPPWASEKRHDCA